MATIVPVEYAVETLPKSEEEFHDREVLESANKDKFFSQQSEVFTTEEEKSVKLVVHAYFVYLVYGVILGVAIGVFVAMVVYFQGQTTSVLASKDQLSQCRDSFEIYSFPPLDQVAYLSPLVYDTNPSPYDTRQYFATANFSACSLSSTDTFATFQHTSGSIGVQSSYLSEDGTYTHGASVYGEPYTGDVSEYIYYTDQSGIHSLSGVRNTSSCFRIDCTLSVFNEADYVTYAMPAIGNSAICPYVEVIATLTVSEKTISAQCVASLYGSLLPYYAISKSAQPSSIYECTVPNGIASTLSQAASLTMTAISIITYLCVCAVFISRVGVMGTYGYLRQGGALSMDAIKKAKK
jgi:hypothetical protein